MSNNIAKSVFGKDSAFQSWEPHVQVPVSHYGPERFFWDNWNNYFWQIKSVISTGARQVLEIGPGSGVASVVLRQFGINLTTVDIDPDLKPDIVGSVTALPFADGEFELVMCCEVLEHMPYQFSVAALKEIRRVARRFAIISIPHVGVTLSVVFRLKPLFRPRELRLHLPHPKKMRPGKEHYWECGRQGFPLRRFRRDVIDSGFNVVSEKRPLLNCNHACFLLAIAPED